MSIAENIIKNTVVHYGGGNQTWSNNFCSGHFREPFDVGKGTVYLSSSRNFPSTREKLDTKPVDFGVYLDSGWKSYLKAIPSDVIMSEDFTDKYKPTFAQMWDPLTPPKVHGIYLPWTDHGAPPIGKLNSLLEWLSPLIDEGKQIEIACMGGHGRTGTLAVALYLYRNKEADPAEVIKLLRATYCKEAIESQVQIDRLYDVVGKTAPKPEPPKVTIYRGPIVEATKVSLAKWLRSPDFIWERLALKWEKNERRTYKTYTPTVLNEQEDYYKVKGYMFDE